jgi:xyloglucan-specific exo-beta-1,4-glucanase
VLVSRNNATFAAVSTLPGDAVIAADKATNANFYGASGSTFFVSTDGGASFSRKGSLGSSTAPFDIAVHPTKSSDIWVTTNKGLFYSSNSGSSFTQISGITEAWGVALGAPASSTAYPSIFVAARIDGAVAYIRSDNTGASWLKINDGYGFGSASANVIAADARVHGR